MPVTSHDYMLLRIDGRVERDDWEVLIPEVMEARHRAADALLLEDPPDTARAERERGTALAAVLKSYDLAEADKHQVAHAVRKEWAKLAQTTRGAVPEEPPASLADLVARHPLPRSSAAALGALTEDDLFAS